MGHLFQEFKRRKVFRVAAVYAIVAWLIIQVAGEILPTFDAPQWVNQTLVLFLILGFPLALVLAWALEMTPEGIKADAVAQPLQTTVQSTDRKLIYAILGLVLLVAGFQITDRILTGEQTSLSPVDREPTLSTVEVTRRNLIMGLSSSEFYSPLNTGIDITPDGRAVIVSSQNENQILSYRHLGELDSRILFETDEKEVFLTTPVISPNGELTLFLKEPQGLAVIPVEGGSVRNLTRVGYQSVDFMGGYSWLDDNTVVYVAPDQSIRTLSITNNSTGVLMEGDGRHLRWPKPVAGTSAIIYTVYSGSAFVFENHIELFDLESGVRKILIENAFDARLLPTGHLVFTRQRGLWAVPFDQGSQSVSGDPVLVVPNVWAAGNYARSIFAVSDSGTLVYLPRTIQPDRPLLIPTWVDRNGQEVSLPMEPAIYGNPRISPDERYLALVKCAQFNSDLWVWDMETQVESRLTFMSDVVSSAWSDNGEYLYFMRGAPDTRGMWQVRLDGTEEPRSIFLSPNWVIPMFTTSNNQELIYINGRGIVNNEVSSVTLSGEQIFGTRVPAADIYEASVLPDQQWLALAYREGGGNVGISVIPFEAGGDSGRRLVSSSGRQPQWSPDGCSCSEHLTLRHRTSWHHSPERTS